MAERKAVIKNADMSEDMQQDAVDCASQALEKYNIEKVKKINCSRIAFHCHHFFQRISPLISKKNLTRSTIPHGTV
jgi:hypothetical protein